MVIGIFLIMSVIVLSLYNCVLTSYMTVPKLKPIVKNFEELAASKEYNLLAHVNSDMSSLFLVSTKQKFILKKA